MLRLADPDTSWPLTVTVPVPLADGSKEDQACTVRLRAPKTSTMLKRDSAILREVVVGWEGIVDHEGEPVEFSAENLERLIEVQYWCQAVARAIVEWVLNGEGSPEGNSARPRAH